MRIGKNVIVRVAFCAALLSSTSAVANLSFNDTLRSVTHDPDCRLNDQPTFYLFTCSGGLTLWYFTKPDHPAYPGFIKRVVSSGPAGWSVHEEGKSFAPDDRQAPFLAWMAQIKELDAQMKNAIARSHGAIR